jgi:hypothetical protein
MVRLHAPYWLSQATAAAWQLTSSIKAQQWAFPVLVSNLQLKLLSGGQYDTRGFIKAAEDSLVAMLAPAVYKADLLLCCCASLHSPALEPRT